MDEHNENFMRISQFWLTVLKKGENNPCFMKKRQGIPGLMIFFQGVFMFSTLKKWFIGRPLKSGAEGEGGLFGKMQALAMLSSDALLLLPMVQSKLSWS